MSGIGLAYSAKMMPMAHDVCPTGLDYAHGQVSDDAVLPRDMENRLWVEHGICTCIRMHPHMHAYAYAYAYAYATD